MGHREMLSFAEQIGSPSSPWYSYQCIEANDPTMSGAEATKMLVHSHDGATADSLFSAVSPIVTGSCPQHGWESQPGADSIYGSHPGLKMYFHNMNQIGRSPMHLHLD